ncbi:flavin-containing monooxygenase [Arthrobacter woluwensis]|uniref:flavin-containing monooxygenase n=1 Tax=Arthrobacter woluwensis TaxID=156980 RepID=UPI001AAF1441|nr:NAD(P)/FAD-dependent oxidoreductase [Arthrobacter woluwensis]QTF73260.1 NAD(P)-binding domain-containing protein [Arthrobacter woluwensis]
MADEEVDVIVVGAGQAGIAMSEHLTAQGLSHVVLERSRIAESWRTMRWDSLVANGPAWHDRFPGLEFEGLPAEGFAPKDRVAEYLTAYAEKFAAPVRCGVEVTAVQRRPGAPGFAVHTTEGTMGARYIVAATGAFQRPVIPAVVPESAPLTQLHSSAYRNPGQLPEGNVLVIGAGSSGVQIAAELQRSGRQVYLAVGAHDRPPRSYRGRDFCWWLGVLGLWDAATPAAGAEHVTIAVSGADGGRTVDFRQLAAEGVVLTGRASAFADGVMTFAPGLAEDVARGDANYLGLLDAADAYIERQGLDLPEEPQARVLLPDPECLTAPIQQLDLVESGITSIIWATGFARDYSWLQVDAFDEAGAPLQQRGVSTEPGVYFLGLPWQSRRGSSFLWGVWHDAKYVADQIAIQESYRAHHEAGVLVTSGG